MFITGIVFASLVLNHLGQGGSLQSEPTSATPVILSPSPDPSITANQVTGEEPPEEIAQLKAKITQLEASVYNHQQITSQMEARLRAVLDQQAQLQRQYSALQARGKEQTAELAALQAEKDQLERDLLSLQGELQQANARMQSLEVELAETQSELRVAVAQAQDLEAQLVAAQTGLQVAGNQILRLQAELAATLASARRALLWVVALGLPLSAFMGGAVAYLYSNCSVALRRQPVREVATRDLWMDESYRERMIQQARHRERRRRQNALAIRSSRPVQVQVDQIDQPVYERPES